MKTINDIVLEANAPKWKDNQYLIIGAFINEKSHIKDYVSYEKITNVKWLIPVLFGEAKEEYQEDWMKEYGAEIVEKIKKEKDKKDFSLCYYGDSGYILITKGSNITEM